jgi:hypothetical protein|nr:MAG TPA: hypothetical protein [Caudoviricetes sp.]
MTLKIAVTNILSRRVTEEEAMRFALEQYGVLAAYIRHELALRLNPTVKVKERKVSGKNTKKVSYINKAGKEIIYTYNT